MISEPKKLKKKPVVLAISGIKNSGKTTILAKLVTLLTQKGYKVGVIKHDGHDFEADTKGTDSYKHKKAGAHNVIVYSQTKMMMVKDHIAPRIEEMIAYQNEMDFVLIEGMKFSTLPKIEVVRSKISTQSICQKETLLALVTDTSLKLEGIPSIGLDEDEKLLNIVLAYGSQQ